MNGYGLNDALLTPSQIAKINVVTPSGPCYICLRNQGFENSSEVPVCSVCREMYLQPARPEK